MWRNTEFMETLIASEEIVAAQPRHRPGDELAGYTPELERELRAAVKGEVRFDDGSRAIYSTDASNYRQVPIGVVVPKSAEDIVAAMAVCRRFGAPVLARGGGTSL